MTLPVKGTGIGTGFTRADGRPFLIIQINVRSQHSADFGFIWGFGIIHLIPEPFQPLGGGNLIGVGLRAAAGGKRGGAGDRTVECAADDGTVVGHLAVVHAAGDGSVVDDLAVEFTAFDGAAGGNGHFAIEHSPAGACNGTGTVYCISQHDVAVNRTADGVKLPIAGIILRAGDV